MVFFILCLLATLSAVESLNCEVCSGTAAADCKNPPLICTPEGNGGCITAAEENTLDGTKTLTFYKGCVDDYNNGIKVPVSFTVGDKKYLKINTTLCNNTNDCNSAVQEMPQGDTASNGRQCPTCFALNADPCTSPVTPCTGDETHCIDFAGTLTTVTSPGKPASSTEFVGKGCATESTTNIQPGNILYSAVGNYTFKTVTSSPAETTTTTPKSTTTTKATTATTSGGSPALEKFSFALYLPGLAGLLLVKLLS